MQILLYLDQQFVFLSCFCTHSPKVGPIIQLMSNNLPSLLYVTFHKLAFDNKHLLALLCRILIGNIHALSRSLLIIMTYIIVIHMHVWGDDK